MKSDLAIYAGWCAERGERALPAKPETVAGFVDAMAEVRAPATVRRYVASIAVAHRAVGCGKTLKSPAVRLALRRMHRRKGRRQRQAHGMTSPLRQRLLEAAGDRLIDDRNRALLAVAYDTMLRRAELTSLQVADLLEEVGGDATLLVRRSKTDGEGKGEIVWVGPDSLKLVRRWCELGGVANAASCSAPSARAGGSAEPLPPGQVARIFKAMARDAGQPAAVVEGLSGHSARVGAAQDMIAAGIELPAILQAGRWKSTAMVNRYGERLLPRRSGAAQLARHQTAGLSGAGSVRPHKCRSTPAASRRAQACAETRASRRRGRPPSHRRSDDVGRRRWRARRWATSGSAAAGTGGRAA